MKTSKLFITSLFAAAAMSIPAFGATVNGITWTDSADGTVRTFTGTATDYVKINGTGTNEGLNGATNVTKVIFNSVGGTGNAAWFTNTTMSQAIELQGTGLVIKGGTNNGAAVFTGAITGGESSSFTWLGDSAAGNSQQFTFSGDLTGFSGSFVRTTASYSNETKTGAIFFGAATATTYSSSATATDGVISNISGTGSITTSAGVVYNYTAASGETPAYTTLSVNNSSITAKTLTFGGGATYTVASALTGQNSTASNNTLTISAGTTTFTGSIANFGTITVASGATADFSNTTFKFGTLTANSVTTTISNSGTVTFEAGTVFDINSYVAGAQLLGGVSTTQTFTIANLSIGGYLANQRGSAAFSVSESGVLTLDSYAEGTNYSLTWNGGDSGVWKANGTGWTTTETTGEVTFQNGDSVTFGTGTENNATIAENLKVGTMTVSAATSLTGTGTIRVDAANLTTTAALTLGENVVLNLGSSASATNKNILGAGTVKFVSTAAGHGGTLTLGNGFTGTIEYSGKFNTSNGTNNANAKFSLSNGSMWGGSGTNTLANDIHFLTNYQLGDTTATTIVLNGNLTQADGTTLTIGTNANTNITFGGAGTVISDLRISAGKLTMNAGQATIKGSQSLVGNLEINSGATVYVGQTDSLNYGGTNTITVNQGGVLDFGGYRWTVGSNNKIVLGGGTIKGTGDANGALDFYRSATVEASAGTTSEISATVKIRNEQEGTKATFTVGADAKLEVSGTIKGDGALQKNGTGELVVSGTNVYTGGTTVNGGVLTVKNATALGTTAGTTTVKSGGVLKIAVNGGLTAGTVTLNEGALLAIDLKAYSNVEEGTALTIISSSAISFNSQEFSSDLMENTFFDLENSDLGSWSSYLREWSYDTTNGLQLTLTIPEPSVFGLLAGLGALALAGTRRRRRKA